MSWKRTAGKAIQQEVVSVEQSSETGETRSIFRYAVDGGFIYQFVTETVQHERFESITFVPKGK